MSELIINTVQEARQACFTGAVRGLRYQGWARCTRAPGKGGCAMNQGSPGIHCAIGWLVPWPKQQWTRAGSYGTASDRELLHPALVAWYHQHPEGYQLRGFLEALQTAHDSGDGTPAKMEGRFKAIGIQFGLKWPKEESDE